MLDAGTIWRAEVHRLVALGDDLFARAGVHRRSVDAELREAAAEAGVALQIAALDVGDGGSVEALFGEVHAKQGRVDVLVNNAGIGGASPLELVPEQEHRAIFETNYWGVVRCIQAVMPGMRERGEGAIVNISSAAGRMATPNQIPYCASKWALEALSESLACELRPFGVRVALVEPGVVATKVFENSAELTRYDKTSPYKPLMQRNGWLYRAGLKHPGRPEDVAQLILDAAFTPNAPLRHVFGADAEALVSGRQRISDEEYIELHELDDDAYRNRFAEIFGIEL